MTKQGLIALKIRNKKVDISKKEEELLAINERSNEILLKLRDDSDNDEIKAIEEELEPIAAQEKEKIEEIAAAKEELEALEKELTSIQDELKPKEEGAKERKMNKGNTEQRSAVNDYIRTKGQVRNFKSEDGEALIPVANVTNKLQEEKGDITLDLAKKVNVENVTTSSGSYPILKTTSAVMNTVEELAENPKLGNPDFDDVDYKIETYRGYIPISQEAIDDSEVDLVKLVEKHIKTIERNTKNQRILNILKTFPAKTASTVDDLKTIKNVDMAIGYNPEWLVTKSFYDAVDRLKDKDGRYLFNESIVSPTGYIFLGRPVQVVEDTHLGTAGDKKAFYGDLKAAVTLFDRRQLGVRWVDHDIYGQLLRGGMRMDIKKVDAKAGFLITATELQHDFDGDGA